MTLELENSFTAECGIKKNISEVCISTIVKKLPKSLRRKIFLYMQHPVATAFIEDRHKTIEELEWYVNFNTFVRHCFQREEYYYTNPWDIPLYPYLILHIKTMLKTSEGRSYCMYARETCEPRRFRKCSDCGKTICDDGNTSCFECMYHI